MIILILYISFNKKEGNTNKEERTFISVLGPQNSGTNLVSNIFSLQDKTAEDTDGQKRLDDEFTIRNRLWKHEHETSKIQNILREPNRKLICVYRDVYTWIKSMKKTPYETSWDGNLDSPVYNGKYKSILHLYKHLYKNYEILKKRFPNRVFFCSYYELIDNENGYNYYKSLCKKLGIDIKSRYKYDEILSKPSKTHGYSVLNSSESVKRIRNNPISKKEKEYIDNFF
tara:strand:+ start:4615 stop:5298 length:684 start_codon:yes stop_codon:yes gene_type:complete